jgi:hypothetical protein
MRTQYCILCLLAVPLSAFADQLTPETAPPVVVRTVPAAGEADVDPSLTELRIEFSKVMRGGAWTWSWAEGKRPLDSRNAYYLNDGRTFCVFVRLEADSSYAFWVNPPNFDVGFKDTREIFAPPYLLVHNWESRS